MVSYNKWGGKFSDKIRKYKDWLDEKARFCRS